MSESKVFSETESSFPESSSPLLENTVHTIKEEVPKDRQERYRYLLELIHESEETNLLKVLNVPELVDLLEVIEREFEAYRKSPSYQVTCRDLPPVIDQQQSNSFVMVILPNQPFVIDSIIEWLTDHSIEVNHLFYGTVPTEIFADLGDEESETFFGTLLIDQQDETRLSELEDSINEILEAIRTAVEDFHPMLDQVDDLRDRLSSLEGGSNGIYANPDIVNEFLQYLIDDSFVFLGYFQAQGNSDEFSYRNRLGLCRPERDLELTTLLPGKIKAGKDPDQLLRCFKTDLKSPVYRRDRLDVIIIRLPNRDGHPGVYVLTGLFTQRVLTQPAVQNPVLRETFESIVENEDIDKHTHDYRDFYTVYNELPNHLLMTFSVGEITEDINLILEALTDPSLKLRVRSTPLRQGLSVLVLVVQDRFSSDLRRQIQDELRDEFEAEILDYQTSLMEESLALLHFDLTTDQHQSVDTVHKELRTRLLTLTRTWEDKLRASLKEDYPDEQVRTLLDRYDSIFNNEYQALVLPCLAARDIFHLESLRNERKNPPCIDITNSKGARTTRLVLYTSEKLSLNDTLPILNNHGFTVEQQSTFQVSLEGQNFHLHLFEITDHSKNPLSLNRNRNLLTKSLRGVLRGIYRDDSLNSLVYREDLAPETLNLLRLYKNYLHQLAPAIKLETINRTLINHSDLTTLLLEYFTTKFDPSLNLTDRASEVKQRRDSFLDRLETIKNRSPYQILRWILKLMNATVRTNFYQKSYPDVSFETNFPTPDSNDRTYVSIKVESERLGDLSGTARYEVFVYSPFMEASHLRGGEIARGGIRWSERRDDYRTEIMELMETQSKKNALIVPVGAKGGFVVKSEYLPDEQALEQQVREQYMVFIRGLLDLTDNRKQDDIEPPPNVIRYDDDDPYLVVAADKGTAQFSDLANRIAEKYDFWLSDAFASGGSSGYDHKELGITSRGAWECVKRHFREANRNIPNEPFTVSGIGDMSGDVFGNGMILSENMKLVAAFNHRHIFLDPDPDPDESYQERRRLFEAKESTWEYYDESVLSKGGGIYSRDASIITLKDEARNLLDLESNEQSPETIIRAILKADVDLIWNGGIGTYIKSSRESHETVEDPRNDPFRVDADQIRADVIGEGGNLGITQRGRVELARNDVRLNTDFIDNSGGVDLSDHEVNFKILLDQSLQNDEIRPDQRIPWLENLKEDAVRRVVNHNFRQSATISLETADSANRIGEFRSVLDHLEENTNLDRDREQLPDEKELQDRQLAGEGITRPEISLIMSYSKQDLYRQSLSTSWPDRTIIDPFLQQYFPQAVTEELGKGLKKHPLKKEIALTKLINYSIDGAGFTFFYRLKDQLDATLVTLCKAYRTADYLAEGGAIRRSVFNLVSRKDPTLKYTAWRYLLDRLRHVVNWLVDTIPESPVYHGFQSSMKEGLQDHFETILGTLQPRQLEYFETNRTAWKDRGLSDELSGKIARLTYLVPVLEILKLARDSEAEDIEFLAETYFNLRRKLHIDWIVREVFDKSPDNRWDQLALSTLGVEVNRIQREIMERILIADYNQKEFLKDNRRTVEHLDEIQGTIVHEGTPHISAYQYMVQRMRNLL